MLLLKNFHIIIRAEKDNKINTLRTLFFRY